MTFSAAPSAGLFTCTGIATFIRSGDGRELPAGNNSRRAAGDRALVMVERDTQCDSTSPSLDSDRPTPAKPAGWQDSGSGSKQACSAPDWNWALARIRCSASTGVASAGEAILDLGHRVRHLHRTRSASPERQSACPARPSGATRRIGPAATPVQPLGQRERPARRGPPAGCISTRTLPRRGGDPGRADERLNRYAGVLVLEGTGHIPGTSPQLVIGASAAIRPSRTRRLSSRALQRADTYPTPAAPSHDPKKVGACTTKRKAASNAARA